MLSDPDLNLKLNGTVTKFGDCPNIDSSIEDIDVLAALEDILKCGGWCSLDNPAEHNPTGSSNGTFYFRFKDIN